MVSSMREYFPEDETQAADLIRHHAVGKQKLLISGGSTRRQWGNVSCSQPYHVLRSTALAGIVAYNPHEMVMTARSGTPLSDIETALAQAGQMMAFEPIDHRPLLATSGSPTIGGVFAANISGPRRFVAGAARDSLLGLRFVNGRGEVVKNGGRVMKNVTGLDLVKLLAGSFGSLGLITEVTFRVPPCHETSCSIAISGLTDSQAIPALAQAMALPVGVSAAAYLPASLACGLGSDGIFQDSATILRLEGLAHSVKLRSEKLQDAMARLGDVTVLEGDVSSQIWREIRDVMPFADGTQRPVWRISVAPATAPQLVEAMVREGKHDGQDMFYDWQGGLIWMRMQQETHADCLRQLMTAHGGGHATLIRGSVVDHPSVSTFHPPPTQVATLSARIKQAFDPEGIFPSLWTDHL